MSSREAILNALSGLRTQVQRVGAGKAIAVGGAAVLALGVAVEAGAAPSPFSPVSEVLGLGDNRGAAVSEAVHNAKADVIVANANNDEGEEDQKIGPAVSEAACEAAHDPTIHPHYVADEGEGEGEGEEEVAEEGTKDCTHPSNLESEEEGDEEGEEVLAEDVEGEDEVEYKNHGDAVSQAVHDAKANLEEGENVGPAVSHAARCAAHDRSTLPDSAQKDGWEPAEECNPDEEGEGGAELQSEESSGGSNGHGRNSAPGQLKKQGN